MWLGCKTLIQEIQGYFSFKEPAAYKAYKLGGGISIPAHTFCGFVMTVKGRTWKGWNLLKYFKRDFDTMFLLKAVCSSCVPQNDSLS